MLTNNDIHNIYKHMQKLQKFNGINMSTGNHPGYIIDIEQNRSIVLYSTMGKVTSIPTTQLSDIHAILQLCHPNKPYYIQHNIHLSDNCPKLPVYIYPDQPDIITVQHPDTRYTRNENEGDYIINPAIIPNIVIAQDEDYIRASNRMVNNLRTSLPFIEQYPDIQYKQHQLYIQQPNISHPKISLIGIIVRHYPSNICIHLSIVYNDLHQIALPDLTISIDDIPNFTDIYHAHIAQAIPDIMHRIEKQFPYSQHEKMHIIRAITQQLTPPNNNALQQIHHAMTIIRDHFAYVSTPPNLDLDQ